MAIIIPQTVKKNFDIWDALLCAEAIVRTMPKLANSDTSQTKRRQLM